MDLQQRFRSWLRPALHLRAASSTFSRLGGLPQLPAELAWPDWNGKPLAFLAQLDLAELHAALPSFLPARGRLWFFYDSEQGVWGFDPAQRDGWRVLFSAAGPATLRERPRPPGLDASHVARPRHVAPFRIELLPDPQRVSDLIDGEANDSEAYEELRAVPFAGGPRHLVLGWPSVVQGDDMELECQLAAHGIYVGSPDGYRDPRVPKLEAGAAEWQLLLQLDSDEDLGWMWGDLGRLYFWVRESDARRGSFDHAWLVLQCS